MKKLLIIIVCAVLLTSLFGCDDFEKYRGEHDSLYTEAMTSLLAVSSQNEETICVIQHDSYGKTLFTYTGDCGYGQSILAIMIAQKEDNEYIYYYEDYNFMIIQVESPMFPATYEALLSFFSEEEIDTLKLENDWDKPTENSRTVRETIINKKNSHPIKQRMLINALKEVDTSLASSITIPLCCDSEGKVIYYVRTSKIAEEPATEYLFMFNKDGSVNTDTGIEELEDLWNYREQLTRFKENNGWKR